MLQAVVQAVVQSSLELGCPSELVYRILRERGLDWAPKVRSLGDRNPGLTE